MSEAAKPWYKSRTLWVNTLIAMASALTINLPMLQPLLGPAFYLTAITLTAGVNCFLRLLTTVPIEGTQAAEAAK